MREHRNPRASVSSRSTPDNRRTAPTAPAPALAPVPEEPDDGDLDALVYVLRDQLRRADGFVTSAEKELVDSWGDGDDDKDGDDGIQRRRCRVEDLVEAGKLAVREAQYTIDQIAAELAARRGDV
jgi:hypothetical protein